MPKQIHNVVRVVVPRDRDPYGHVGMLIENLRYCGVVREHNRVGSIVFDINPPAGIAKTEIAAWAERNAERMRSFGYNAVSSLGAC